MPRLSCWFIRMALVHLGLGLTVGAAILVQKGLGWFPWAWRLLPAHIEFLLFGWTLQLILGVAFWIFPRFRRSRGWETPVWIAFGLLNLGVWLVSLAPLLGSNSWLSLTGRLAEVGAAGAFTLHAWPRIKPPGA